MITAVLVGAGNRGKDAYGAWALKQKQKLRFVALAEPLPERRRLFASAHKIAPEHCYKMCIRDRIRSGSGCAGL